MQSNMNYFSKTREPIQVIVQTEFPDHVKKYEMRKAIEKDRIIYTRESAKFKVQDGSKVEIMTREQICGLLGKNVFNPNFRTKKVTESVANGKIYRISKV